MRSHRQRLKDATRRRARAWLGAALGWIALAFVGVAALSSFLAAASPRDWLPSLALFLSLGSLLLGLRSSLEQQQRMTTLEGLLSTASIGEFPEHIDEITRLAAGVRRDFYCVVDCVDYASFSDPEGHRRLTEAIEHALTKKPRATVRILICGEPAAITSSSPLYALPWTKLQQTAEFTEYFSTHYPGDQRPTTEEAFRQLLLHRQQLFAEQLRSKGADIRTTTHPCSQFLWIADDREAVFLWLSEKHSAAMHAYRTRDTRLIESLKAAFDANWPSDPSAIVSR